MPKKSFQKKKRFQAHCREQVVGNDKINLADGSWGDGQNNAMKEHMKAGYRAGIYAKK